MSGPALGSLVDSPPRDNIYSWYRPWCDPLTEHLQNDAMSSDPNKKSPRTFQCRDMLWETFEQMARELECSVDYLINEAMKQYARQRSYGQRTPYPAQQGGSRNSSDQGMRDQGMRDQGMRDQGMREGSAQAYASSAPQSMPAP